MHFHQAITEVPCNYDRTQDIKLMLIGSMVLGRQEAESLEREDRDSINVVPLQWGD